MERLKRIRNGERVTPTFSPAEMNRRLDSLRAHMAAADMDGTLFTSYHNINYFSDFPSLTFPLFLWLSGI